MLSLLRQQGVRHVLEDSSGNGGASVAAYAAAGGLKATIMAPDSTSTAKTIAMRAHGADVELIPGSRQACADAAVAAHGRGGSVFYASHNWHPFFLQGTKTLAYARSSTQASRLVRCRACWREYIGKYCVCIGVVAGMSSGRTSISDNQTTLSSPREQASTACAYFAISAMLWCCRLEHHRLRPRLHRAAPSKRDHPTPEALLRAAAGVQPHRVGNPLRTG